MKKIFFILTFVSVSVFAVEKNILVSCKAEAEERKTLFADTVEYKDGSIALKNFNSDSRTFEVIKEFDKDYTCSIEGVIGHSTDWRFINFDNGEECEEFASKLKLSSNSKVLFEIYNDCGNDVYKELYDIPTIIK